MPPANMGEAAQPARMPADKIKEGNPMTSSHYDTGLFCNSGGQFLLWTLVFVLLHVALTLILRWRRVEWPVARAAAILGPLLPAVFWIYGLLFLAPGNAAKACRYGFFQYWFSPDFFHDADFSVHAVVLLAVAAFLTLAGVLATMFWTRRAKGPVLSFCAYGAWYISAQAFYGAIALTRSEMDHPYYGGWDPTAMLVAGAGIILFLIGGGFAWASSRWPGFLLSARM